MVLGRLKIVLLAVMLAFTFQSMAQSTDDNHFIYIQAKNKQPFYVILNSKVYSSSSIGYLIIPKLQSGTYDIKVGFPKQDAPEHDFKCVIKDADLGYSLQQNDAGALGLLDLQSQKFLASSGTSVPDIAKAPVPKPVKTVVLQVNKVEQQPATASGFGDMLASVSSDSTLLVKSPEKTTVTDASTATPKAVLQPDQTVGQPANSAQRAQEVVSSYRDDAAASQPVTALNSDDLETYGVIKSSEQNSNKGRQMTFVLFNNNSSDTVSAFIPSGKQKIARTEGAQPAKNGEISANSLALFPNTAEDDAFSGARDQTKFVDIHTSASSEKSHGKEVDNPFYDKRKSSSRITADTQSEVVPAEDAPCDNPVTDKDMEKMKRRMVMRNNDDDMVAIVDKYIKGKCISTLQVKQLGGLFLSDAGRFALFQDTYSRVSDKGAFASLQNQLLDSYFKKRFQEMLK